MQPPRQNPPHDAASPRDTLPSGAASDDRSHLSFRSGQAPAASGSGSSSASTPARESGLNQLHVCLQLDPGPMTDGIVKALEQDGRHRVTVMRDLGELTSSAATPDAVLIGLQHFTALRENEPMVYLRLSRRSRIIVVLSSRELLDAAHVLAFADAWVFEDINIDRISDLLDLGLEGHCLMPKQFLSRLGVDEIRLSLIPRLSDPEFQTLRLLGQGLNNRTIANALDLSEAVIKSMVRSVLSKLHFRNRTEAGVFAARQHGMLEDTSDARAAGHMGGQNRDDEGSEPDLRRA